MKSLLGVVQAAAFGLALLAPASARIASAAPAGPTRFALHVELEAPRELHASLAADRAELALNWAPIHFQGTNQRGAHSLGGAADFIARYDFDGDLNARNNWQNAGSPRFPLAAHAYFSVTETPTHWFIVYLFFHPRDWSSSFFDTEHENDSEGLLLGVARDGTRYGALKAAVTVAHRDFFSYLPRGSDWRAGAETVDGVLSLEPYQGGLHPVTAQQDEGHGLKARPYYDIRDRGIVYYPSLGAAEVPRSPNDRHVSYRLVDIFEPGGMWDNRNNALLFAKFGSFAGDKSDGCGQGALWCATNAAHAPWAWDDADDALPAGSLAIDPARLVKRYFRIPEPTSASYTFNPYRTR